MYVSETVQIDSLRGLLDISLIVHLALTAVCVDVLLAMPHLLTIVYHTQVSLKCDRFSTEHY